LEPFPAREYGSGIPSPPAAQEITMTPRISPRHPFKALVAVAAMFAVVHGVCAHADTRDDEITNVNVVGQLPLHLACPDLDDEDLADELSTAWDAVEKPSAVAVTFKLQNHHVYDVTPQSDSLRATHQIRHVVHGLSCDGGDDQPHAVRFVIRFIDRDNGSRVASISDVTIDGAPGR
jgi:hypothetical protein